MRFTTLAVSLCLLGAQSLTVKSAILVPSTFTPAEPPSVQFDFKVLDVAEKNSDQCSAKISASLAKSDADFLRNPDLDVLSAPTVATEDGLPAHVEVTREMSYATQYDKDKAGDFVPSHFQTRKVGVQIEALSRGWQGGSVSFDLKCTITSFVGWIHDPSGCRVPVFDIRRLTTQKVLSNGASEFLWIGPDLVEHFNCLAGRNRMRKALIVTVHRLES